MLTWENIIRLIFCLLLFFCLIPTNLEWIVQSKNLHYRHTNSRFVLLFFLREVWDDFIVVDKRSLLSPNTQQLLVHNWTSQHWRTRWLLIRKLNLDRQRPRRILVHFIQNRTIRISLHFLPRLNVAICKHLA